jgi:hypothetical protein
MFILAAAALTLATIKIPGLDESSGLVASQSYPGIFWTMNDGSGPYLYAFDRSGKKRARVRVRNATAYDWEDLALARGSDGRWSIYIGDIGDNGRKRKSLVVYRIEEPTLGATSSGPADVFRFRYPDGPHDAEALLVHPRSGDLYIVTKAKGLDPQTRVYKAASPLSTSRTTVLSHVADIPLPSGSILSMLAGRVTGGSISPDGKRVIICDYERGWEAIVPGTKFDAVWTSEWIPLDLGSRSQGEAVAYRHDGKAVLATSEGSQFHLNETRLTNKRSEDFERQLK